MIISKNLAAIKKCASQHKKPWQNAHQWVEDGCGENEEKNNNDTSQTI